MMTCEKTFFPSPLHIGLVRKLELLACWNFPINFKPID